MANAELREVYAKKLIELAEKDDRIVLVEADLSKAVKTNLFSDVFPERLIDVGVAEANMMGVAAGLSAMGLVPFTHSFTAFTTRRCYDQIVVSIAYSKLNVKIMGSDPGVTAELNGGTHMSFEDVGIMRNIPNMVIYEPVDEGQLVKALPQIVEHEGPVYIRLNRKTTETVLDENLDFTLGKACTLREGKDITLIATGIMVKEALAAADQLRDEGISAKVVNIHTVKPIDKDAIVEAAKQTGAIVVCENHSIINGLGSAVAEVLIENDAVPMERVGIQDHFGEVGKLDFLMEKYHLISEDIVNAAKKALDRKL